MGTNCGNVKAEGGEMTELKEGQEVLIKVRILQRARDERPINKRGWLVLTSRGNRAYVEPEDIFVQYQETEWTTKQPQ